MSGAFSGQKIGRTNRSRKQFAEPKTGKTERFSKLPTHGHGAAGLSWIGAGLLVLGIVLSAASGSPYGFWILGGLAVQCWIAAAIIRPIEAIWTLLNERLPKRQD